MEVLTSLLATVATLQERSALINSRYEASCAAEGLFTSRIPTTCVVTPSPREGVKHLVYWLVPKAGSSSARTFSSNWRNNLFRDFPPPPPSPPPPSSNSRPRNSDRWFPDVCPEPQAHTGYIMQQCGSPCVRRFVGDDATGAVVFGVVREPLEKFYSGFRYTERLSAVRCRHPSCPAPLCPPAPWERTAVVVRRQRGTEGGPEPPLCKPPAVAVNVSTGAEGDSGRARWVGKAPSSSAVVMWTCALAFCSSMPRATAPIGLTSFCIAFPCSSCISATAWPRS